MFVLQGFAMAKKCRQLVWNQWNTSYLCKTSDVGVDTSDLQLKIDGGD